MKKHLGPSPRLLFTPTGKLIPEGLQAMGAVAKAFSSTGLAARRVFADMAPLTAALLEIQRIQRGPTIGRKRRTRRASGRRGR